MEFGMMMNKLGEDYWDNRYKSKNTPWDLSVISPPLKKFIDGLDNRKLKILIPGCGTGNEAKYLLDNGFTNVFVNDISQVALTLFRKKIPYFPVEQIIEGNFFDIEKSFYLILEQTFFCALEPQLRINYVKKVFNLLTDGGRLVGLLFDFPLSSSGPPFGGSIKEYRELFKNYFKINIMDTSYNSIESRKHKELFFIFTKAI